MRNQYSANHQTITGPAAAIFDHLANAEEDLGMIDPMTISTAAYYMSAAAGGRFDLVQAIETGNPAVIESWRWDAYTRAENDMRGADAASVTLLHSTIDCLTYYPESLMQMIHEYLESLPWAPSQ